MATKQFIKKTEAKILVYLNNVDRVFKNATFMAHKLDMEYNFLLIRLRGMKLKGWVMRIKSQNKVFWNITTIAPLQKAIEVLHPPQKNKK
tara:strand:+ start:340 stop:609 length:270 start_codon:yes stop_codon:yes gene_type:complete